MTPLAGIDADDRTPAAQHHVDALLGVFHATTRFVSRLEVNGMP